MGPIEKVIFDKLNTRFNPVFIELVNESYKHSVPPGSETHFKLLMVSELFLQQSRVQRQRLVNEVIAEELKTKVHAFSQKLMTPGEWEKEGAAINFKTPDCAKPKA